MTDFDMRELYALSADLGDVPAKALRSVIDVVRDGGTELRDRWKANARETSGTHGRLYPNSIHATTFTTTSGIEAEIGPVTSMPQGKMGPGFEFGSVNQPAHLDGQRATDEVIPRIERRLWLAAEDVFDA
jgi:hypothetical protein